MVIGEPTVRTKSLNQIINKYLAEKYVFSKRKHLFPEYVWYDYESVSPGEICCVNNEFSRD